MALFWYCKQLYSMKLHILKIKVNFDNSSGTLQVSLVRFCCVLFCECVCVVYGCGKRNVNITPITTNWLYPLNLSNIYLNIVEQLRLIPYFKYYLDNVLLVKRNQKDNKIQVLHMKLILARKLCFFSDIIFLCYR